MYFLLEKPRLVSTSIGSPICEERKEQMRNENDDLSAGCRFAPNLSKRRF